MSTHSATRVLAVRRNLSIGLRRRMLLRTLRASATSATKGGSPKKTRKRIARLSRLAPPVPGVLSRYDKLGSVHARWFEPKGSSEADRTIFYLHGGGFAVCDLRSHRILASQVAKAAGIKSVAVAYRRAPNHPFPTPLYDCLEAYRALVDGGTDPKHIVVVGDSAGGNLALGLTQLLRDQGEPLPAALALISPWVDLTMAGETVRSNASKDYLHPSLLEIFADSYLQGHDAEDPLVSPIRADFSGFPPMLLQVGTHEVLLSEVRAVAAAARDHGAQVELQEWENMFHAFHGFSFALTEAWHAFAEMGDFIRAHLPETVDMPSEVAACPPAIVTP